jgi:hypothetical protein
VGDADGVHVPRLASALAVGLCAGGLVLTAAAAARGTQPDGPPPAAAPSLALPVEGEPADEREGDVAPLAGTPVVSEEDHAVPANAAVIAYGTTTATPPVNPPCTSPGTSGNRIQAVYAYYGTSPNRVSTVTPYIVDALKRANGIVYHSARQTGGSRHLRLATTSTCQPSIAVAHLSSTARTSFSTTVSELGAKGYTATNRKYVVFADARSVCGLGQTYLDDQPGTQNRNNRGPQVARVDLGCWSGSAVAHEVFHMLGAVQKSAPHSDAALHCRDERDVMCYPGAAGGTPIYTAAMCTSTTLDERLDCNKDDFFHTAPKAGSYLATHWNTARSAFLWGGGGAYQFAPAGVRSATSSTPTASTVRLAWAAPSVSASHSAATGYRVLRGTSALSMTSLATTSFLSFSDAAPLSGTSYYWLVPYNAGGNGPRISLTITR